MSSKALEQDGKYNLLSLSARLSATRRMLVRKVRTAGLRFPLLTLAGTAAFWSIVWLLDTTPVHALSPVNALLRIYGTGILVVATMVIVGASLWLIAKRLGYADRFAGALFEHADDIGPVPSAAESPIQGSAAPAPVADYIFAALPAAPARLQLEATPKDDGARPASAAAAPAVSAPAAPAVQVAEATAVAAMVLESSVASTPEDGTQGTPARPLAKANPLKKGKGRRK